MTSPDPIEPKTGDGPLAGVRILDLTSVFMGPLATSCLADLGADVIKVESPDGDVIRSIGPGGEDGVGAIFQHLNRNKRSIVLDLKDSGDLASLLELVKDADVLVYNIRPAAMTRLGLGWERLHALNPRLIFAGTFGYSQRGCYAAEPAFDDLIQAASGLAHSISVATGGPPAYAPVTVADRAVGYYAFGAIAAALFARERTGKGQRVDVPMFETMTSFVMGDHMYGHTYENPQADYGYPRLMAKTRRPYRTQDGYVCCTVYTDAQWRAFLNAAGRGEMFDEDSRFRDLGTRTRHIEALYGLVEDILQTRTTLEWRTILSPHGIPIFPVHDFDSLLEDPHLKGIDFFASLQDVRGQDIRLMNCPSEWSNGLPGIRSAAPRKGAHTDEVLASIRGEVG
ncbi:CoA transferase [Hyphomonas sp. WL0036]|uniref:CaiB/BaiF CoA transferase family protein n=1 Tax=Hyphomonas sediminis TaxID=2866160 RepID=UPI001C7E9F3E|nr:CoA transferase [Hyphomonas sediminis]MBY9068150.1 CoA transferase [Hyphomonas sediminis]